MAQLYFAKFNINSDIYNVYDDKGLKNKILKSVFFNMNEETQHVDKPNTVNQARFKFCALEKNVEEFYVAGRLIKIFKGDFSRYNEKKDDIDTFYFDDSASGITFFFDLTHEQIAFSVRRDFGRKEFIEKFQMLIEDSVKDYEFEITLESNIDEFKERLNEFKIVSEVRAIIIPPNGEKRHYDKLFGANAKEIKQANATKYTQVLNSSVRKGTGINTESDFMDRMMYGVGMGYSVVTVKGRNRENDEYTITTDEDTPLKRYIPDNAKNSISGIIEHGKRRIKEIVLRKMGIDKDGGSIE